MKQFIFTVVQQAVREVITKEVNTRIDTVEKNLGQRIDALDQRLDTVEKSLTQHINDVEKNLTQQINDVEKNLTERFEIRFDNIERAVATVQGNLEGEARFFHLADYVKQQSHAG